MGAARGVRGIVAGAEGRPRGTGASIARQRPRSFAEWQALRRWGKLPEWERGVAGYLLRASRETAGLTQAELGTRLGASQQAVAQAERWTANPTIGFMRRWAAACGVAITLQVGA